MHPVTNIFLVDDDIIDQEFFIAALNFIDNVSLYDVAKNGKEALETLESTNDLPSIIFMDVDMPLMNGIECLENIIKNPKTKNIPVVMLTSSNYQSTKTKGIGARGFILKPDDEKTLIRKIREAVDSIYRSEKIYEHP